MIPDFAPLYPGYASSSYMLSEWERWAAMFEIDGVSIVAKRRNLMVLSVAVMFWALGGHVNEAFPLKFPDETSNAPVIFLFIATLIAFWRYHIDPRKESYAFDRKVATVLDRWFSSNIDHEIVEKNLFPGKLDWTLDDIYERSAKEKFGSDGVTWVSGLTSARIASYALKDKYLHTADVGGLGWRPEYLVVHFTSVQVVPRDEKLRRTFPLDDEGNVEEGHEVIRGERTEELSPVVTVTLRDHPHFNKLVRKAYRKIYFREIREGNEFFDIFGPYLCALLAACFVIGRVVIDIIEIY